jgi:hypothetical protein
MQQKDFRKLPHQECHIPNPFQKSYPKKINTLIVIKCKKPFF